MLPPLKHVGFPAHLFNSFPSLTSLNLSKFVTILPTTVTGLVFIGILGFMQLEANLVCAVADCPTSYIKDAISSNWASVSFWSW